MAALTGDQQEILKETDDLHRRVQKPREQALDSELFAFITEVGSEHVTKLARGGKSYTVGDFIRRLKAHYVHDADAQELGAADPSAFDWAAVGRVVARLFKPAPVVFHMLGPMDARPKEKRQVVRQKRKAQVGEAVRPEEVEQIGDQEKQETDKNMEEMWGVLKERGGRVNLLNLVLNHRSFAQTVENLFTLSFLVRDQRVELQSSEAGTEVVVRTKAAAGGQKSAGEKERVQFVISLDIEEWEGWCSVVAPSDCLMRHRPEHHQQEAGLQQQQQQLEQEMMQQQVEQQESEEDEEEAEREEEEEEQQQRQQRRPSTSKRRKQQ
ncbi:hypothetical protein N2152v2_008006 [Parachlorella kessleri]